MTIIIYKITFLQIMFMLLMRVHDVYGTWASTWLGYRIIMIILNDL